MTSQPQLLEGWLKKRGEKGLINAPKLRYFLQSGTNLDYFIEKNTFSPQGSIDLRKIQHLVQKNVTSFNIVSATGRTYELEIVSGQGKDQDRTMEYWLNGLKSWKDYFSSTEEKRSTSNRDSVNRDSVNRGSVNRDSFNRDSFNRDSSNQMKTSELEKNTLDTIKNVRSPRELVLEPPTTNNTSTIQHSSNERKRPEETISSSNPFQITQNNSHESQSQIQISNLKIENSNPSQTLLPLWKIIKDGKENQLKQYLATSKIRLKSVEPFQMSPLHYAVVCGSVNSIKILIINGCAPNALDTSGQTPLLYAIEKHTGKVSSDMVEVLLNSGANPNEGDLVNEFSPLNAACLAGNEEIVRSLVIRGVNINQEDKRLKWTPLHWASAGGSMPIVQFLVNEKGIKFQRNRIPTPEQIAKDGGFLDIANFLSKI